MRLCQAGPRVDWPPHALAVCTSTVISFTTQSLNEKSGKGASSTPAQPIARGLLTTNALEGDKLAASAKSCEPVACQRTQARHPRDSSTATRASASCHHSLQAVHLRLGQPSSPPVLAQTRTVLTARCPILLYVLTIFRSTVTWLQAPRTA
jgi:hypothetical protein